MGGLGPVAGLCVSFLAESFCGSWWLWAASMLLLMGCGAAVEVGVPLPWLLLAGLLFSPPRHLVTVCCLPVLLALGIPFPCVSGSKCLWSECFLNVLLLLPATEINATNTVAVPRLRPLT